MNADQVSPITIETTIQARRTDVWACWTDPKHITQWNFALDTWHCPSGRSELRTGGSFSYTMAARDGSMSFEFAGTFTEVREPEFLSFALGDKRTVRISFVEIGDATRVVEIFDPERSNPRDIQTQGWKAILENFKKYVEHLFP